MIIFKNKCDKKTRKICEFSYESLRDFFEMELENIFIETLENRNELNQRIGRKTQDWLVAFAKTNYVYILDKKSFVIESSHLEKDFEIILKHELAHIFINAINPNAMQWLDEGLALNLARQKKAKQISKENYDFFILFNNIYKNLALDEFAKRQGYIVSYKLVNNLLDKLDKNIILELLRLDKNRKDLKKSVENIIDCKLDELIKV